MSYKTIVAVLSAAEDAGKVTDHALALARRTGGHVVGIHAESPVVVTLIAPMEYPDPSAVLDLQERARRQSREVEQAFRSRCERDDISYEWRLFTGTAGYASAGVIDSARGADIVIAGQFDPDADGPAQEDIEDLLYESGRRSTSSPMRRPVPNRSTGCCSPGTARRNRRAPPSTPCPS